MHAHDQRFDGRDPPIGNHDAFEFVLARLNNGGAFVHFVWIEEIQYRDALHGKNLVHPFDAESAFAIEEVGDMSLFETGLPGETQLGQFSAFDTLKERFAEIFLERPKFHLREYMPHDYNFL